MTNFICINNRAGKPYTHLSQTTDACMEALYAMYVCMCVWIVKNCVSVYHCVR